MGSTPIAEGVGAESQVGKGTGPAISPPKRIQSPSQRDTPGRPSWIDPERNWGSREEAWALHAQFACTPEGVKDFAPSCSRPLRGRVFDRGVAYPAWPTAEKYGLKVHHTL